MRTSRMVFGVALVALAFGPLIAAAGLALATVVAPEGISGTAQALSTAADLAKALSARNWSAALGPALLLIGFVLKSGKLGPFALMAKVPPRYRALAMAVGGTASVAGAMIAAGTPAFEALLSGLQASMSATGIYEIVQGIRGATHSEDVRKAVREAMALAPGARDAALAKIGSAT